MKSIILIGIIALLPLGYMFGANLGYWSAWSDTFFLTLLIVYSGAYGGMLYTARDSGLEIPHIMLENKNIIRLGWIADCAYGIAGALVVFLVVPADLNESITYSLAGMIKIIGLSIVGGYGGRKLVDRALSNIEKKVDEAIKTAEDSKEKINQIQETDPEARKLVNMQLEEDSVEDKEKLKKFIKSSSRSARLEIFLEARNVRSLNWKNNKEKMERTIPIFEALIDNEEGKKYHRNHGNLGYALKDKRQPDWSRAHAELTKAIQLRNMDGERGFLFYEFNRAICAIKLGMNNSEIEKDLRAAAHDSQILEVIHNSNIVKKWAEENDINFNKLIEKATL